MRAHRGERESLRECREGDGGLYANDMWDLMGYGWMGRDQE